MGREGTGACRAAKRTRVRSPSCSFPRAEERKNQGSDQRHDSARSSSTFSFDVARSAHRHFTGFLLDRDRSSRFRSTCGDPLSDQSPCVRIDPHVSYLPFLRPFRAPFLPSARPRGPRLSFLGTTVVFWILIFSTSDFDDHPRWRKITGRRGSCPTGGANGPRCNLSTYPIPFFLF